jgi:hypothetical protein
LAVTIPMPRARRIDLKRALRDWSARAAKLAKPVRAPLRNLLACPLTALGFAAFDVGVFQWSHRAGWLVMGVLLVVLEHVIADED